MVELSLVVLCLALLLVWFIMADRKEQQISRERAEWKAERQMLLDRIQAPSFAEYTNKVVREKKAEQPEEEPEPIEFIS